MYKKILLIIVASLSTLGVVKADTIERMRLVRDVAVRRPVVTDSVNVKGEAPDFYRIMFQSGISLEDERAGAREIAADSSGYVMLDRQDGNRIYLLTTRLRADRFANATLRFRSPSRFEVYVDGAMQRSKMSVQDSLSLAESCEFRLRMEPQMLYKVAVKMLVADNDSCAPALKGEWELRDDTVTTISCSPSLKSRYLLPNTIYGSRISGMRISPDGRYLLTTYWDNLSAKSNHHYTVLSEVKSGKKIATYPAGYKSIAWMPASPKFFYKVVSVDGEKIIAVDPVTLQESVVADNIPRGSFVWSPDEKSLYYSITETIEGDNGPVHRMITRSNRLPGSRNRSFIWRYDIAAGACERLTWGLDGASLCDISKDGKSLLFICSEPDDDKWPFRKSSLYKMNVETLKVDTLVKDDSFMSKAYFSPDASQVLLIGGPEAFGGVGKNCGNHPIANNYDEQAFIMNVADKSINPITKDFAPSVSFLQWNSADGNIYFLATERDLNPVYRYNTKQGKFELLPLEGDCVRSFSIADKSGVAAYTSVTASSGQAGYLYDVRKRKSTLVADPYAKVLESIEMGEIHDWNFTASDGTEIDGYYCLPPGFDASKKYPLIVYYYGGTTPTQRTMDNPYSAQLFASRGYVVYIINPSGTIGYGQEFSARHVNAWGKRTADDIIEGTRRFCSEHPYVDAEHIGCLGASYGGFMTQYLQTQTDIFAAAASHAGISNVTSYWGEGYWGVGYNAVAAAQSYPWSNAELFTKQGSLFNADKINTPLLLLHGTADTNVPVGESIQLFNALRILGKTVEFIQVDGEDHFIADVPKRVLWHNSIMAWFERWLKEDSRWWDDIYPHRHVK
ncbi:MAG: S9 family peptidase [Bacteroidaceae bacterium]|nr:S9 family peptidase [Bacteroidaceae bacterium]